MYVRLHFCVPNLFVSIWINHVSEHCLVGLRFRAFLSTSLGHGDHDVVLIYPDHHPVNVGLDLVHHLGRHGVGDLALDVVGAILPLPPDAFRPRPVLRIGVAERVGVDDHGGRGWGRGRGGGCGRGRCGGRVRGGLE
jgi:hypothetical protein